MAVGDLGGGRYHRDRATPRRPGKILRNTDVNFKADPPYTADDDAACTGTWQAPTAPPGKVCLYLRGYTTDSSQVSGGGLTLRQPSFTVSWYDDQSVHNSVFLNVVWAYTAP